MGWGARLGCLLFLYPKAFEIKREAPRLENRQETKKLSPILQIRLNLSPRQKSSSFLRWGFARVPYKGAELLVYDEATTDHFSVINCITAALKKCDKIKSRKFLN